MLAHAASKLKRPARRVTGGTTFEVGTKTVTVIDAPGHTPDSLAILVDGHLFTGDALFAGGAGRTDFMGGSASALFDTLRVFEALPDDTVVHPGHDYVGRPVTTIGEEKARNPLLREHDRAAFVSRLSGTASPPANMAAILRHNLGEVEAPTIAPRDLQALRETGSRRHSSSTCEARWSSRVSGSRERASSRWTSSKADSTRYPTRRRSSWCAARACAPPSRPRCWLGRGVGRASSRAA